MKKYYEIGEKIFVGKLKRSGIIKDMNIENKEVTVSYFDGKDEEGKPIFKQEVLKFWDINKYRELDKITFAKVKPEAIIPSKRREDGAYDVYACFEEDYIEIQPGEIKMIPTGIASAFSPKYRFSLRERGSSGSKGLAKRCGEIDSGYRDQWFVAINNSSKKIIIIAKKDWLIKNDHKFDETYTIYPYEKAIIQAALEIVPHVRTVEKTYDELKEIHSERGLGKLGSTNK